MGLGRRQDTHFVGQNASALPRPALAGARDGFHPPEGPPLPLSLKGPSGKAKKIKRNYEMNKSVNLKTRITEDLHESVKVRAEKEGVSVSHLTRDLIKFGLDGISQADKIMLKQTHQDLCDLMQKNVQIGSNLNQIAYHLNSGKLADMNGLKEAHSEMREQFASTIKAMSTLKSEIDKRVR